MKNLENVLLNQILEAGLPVPEREYRFAAKAVGDSPGVRERLKESNLKNWRFDFCWPDKKLAVEVEGGIWIKGGHVTGQGYEEDRIKYGEAMKLGWRVYSCTSNMIKSKLAINTIIVLFNQEI